MKIVIVGAKASGKSSFGREFQKLLGIPCLETDDLVASLHHQDDPAGGKTCREIFDALGEEGFRELEERAVRSLEDMDWGIVVTGGSTFASPANRRILRQDAVIIFCRCAKNVLRKRVERQLVGAVGMNKAVYLKWYEEDVEIKDELYAKFADLIIATDVKPPEELAAEARELLGQELAVRMTSANTFGELVRITTFGESHGPAVGVVLDGISPGIELSAEDIQRELDRRRPGQSKITTARKEADRVHVLSGTFNGVTTGCPIAMIIHNQDCDSARYEELKDVFRPGHADFTFHRKYAIRDHRGGGRSSGRETAARVAGGAVAMKILAGRGVRIVAHAVEIGGVAATAKDHGEIERNIVRCADAEAAARMVEAIDRARAEGDSVGGIVQLEIEHLPAGLGDPVFAKLDARLAYAMMTIGAVKGVEVGDGFGLARRRGSEANDPMADGEFRSNRAGGILGGISTGQPVLLRIAVKPTPSIAYQQQTIDKDGRNVDLSVGGRHDPCIVPRIIPVIESMAALVVLDAWEIQERLRR